MNFMTRRSLVLIVLTVILASAGLLSSCASRMLRDSSLTLEVVPLPVLRGKQGKITVNAPMNAKEVIGKVRVAGSPDFIFVRDKKRSVWYFLGTIPFSPWIKPGEYTIRVIVKNPPEKDRYTEMKIELK